MNACKWFSIILVNLYLLLISALRLTLVTKDTTKINFLSLKQLLLKGLQNIKKEIIVDFMSIKKLDKLLKKVRS